jgi:SET domain-containing protein
VKPERKPRPLIEVRDSTIQGKGMFALRPIKKGMRLIEYIGERITDDQADERYDDEGMARHHTFLFSLDDGTCLDAANIGNEAKYINHSCAPNCEAINEEGRIFIESIADIPAGGELTYDYAYVLGEGVRRTKKLLQRYACRCGAPTCRGSILGVPEEKAPRSKRKMKSSKRK